MGISKVRLKNQNQYVNDRNFSENNDDENDEGEDDNDDDDNYGHLFQQSGFHLTVETN